MTSDRATHGPRGPWAGAAACTAVTLASFITICASAGPPRLIAGLGLLAALAGALLLVHRARPCVVWVAAIVPAIGLTLAFLVLAGLALAAVRSLTAVPTALTVAAATLAAAWASARYPDAGRAGRHREREHRMPGTLAVAGVLVFAVAATLAIRYAAASATADSGAASSLAVWAYPAADQLHVGAQQPAGRGGTSLRIVVTQAGATAAAWNDVRLAPGQDWEAPPLTLTGTGPVRVIALRGATIVASLSVGAIKGVGAM